MVSRFRALETEKVFRRLLAVSSVLLVVAAGSRRFSIAALVTVLLLTVGLRSVWRVVLLLRRLVAGRLLVGRLVRRFLAQLDRVRIGEHLRWNYALGGRVGTGGGRALDG